VLGDSGNERMQALPSLGSVGLERSYFLYEHIMRWRPGYDLGLFRQVHGFSLGV
jgi:hypothetical protein